MFKLQLRDFGGSKPRWKDFTFACRFATVADAVAYGRTLDQDGWFDRHNLRVVDAFGRRVDIDGVSK